MKFTLTKAILSKDIFRTFKTLLLLCCTLLSSQLFAQKVDRYIEVWQRVTVTGSTRIEGAAYPEDKKGNRDTLIGVAKIEETIKAAKRDKKPAIWVINELSKEGWSLVSSVFVPGSDFNSGYTSYYLKKTFDQ